jgi:hypothetical protein
VLRAAARTCCLFHARAICVCFASRVTLRQRAVLRAYSIGCRACGECGRTGTAWFGVK